MSYFRASHSPDHSPPLPTAVQTSSMQGARTTGRGSGRSRATAQLIDRPPARTKRKAPQKRRGLAQCLRVVSRLMGDRVSQKALWAGGSVATLALLAVVPNQGTSKAVSQSSCQAIVQSGAEISRGQISRLLAVPEGSAQAAVRQVVNEPYCVLPTSTTGDDGQPTGLMEREAYPLAFDREAWLVVNYQAGEYAGYDFVFKP